MKKEIIGVVGGDSMECSNQCFHNKRTCSWCKENRDVSSDFYRAKRPANGYYVTGYLVKDKEGRIEGILNKDTQFYELAWIDESTLEKVEI